MEGFWKAIAAALLAVLLNLVIEKTEKDISLLITIAVCSMIATIAITYLKPVFNFLREVDSLGKLQDNFLALLLKAVAVAVVSELAAMICADAGNNSIANALRMLGSAAIAYIAIPIFQSVLIMIQDLLFRL